MAKLVPAFRALPREMQQAAACAAALMLTLFLPWYTAQLLSADGRSFNRTAWGEFSFVEAAVLLVAAGVLYLVWARSQNKAFHLPGGDGTVIMVAGAWAALLIIWRLFDTPEANTIEFGLQWGIFVALAAAIALSLAGARVRAAHRPEPPNPAAEEQDWERRPREAREPRRARRRGGSPAVTEVLSDLPDWEGDVPEDGRAKRAEPGDVPEAPGRAKRAEPGDVPEAPGRAKRAEPPGAVSDPSPPPRERRGDEEDPPADRLF